MAPDHDLAETNGPIGLVVFDDDADQKQLLKSAGAWARGTDATLLFVVLLEESEFERDIETVETINEVEDTTYGDETVLSAAKQSVREAASETIDVPFETIADVVDGDRRAARIVEVAESNGCSQIFVSGRRRSPTGKAIFGNTAQRVILNFDGPVTVEVRSS